MRCCADWGQLLQAAVHPVPAGTVAPLYVSGREHRKRARHPSSSLRVPASKVGVSRGQLGRGSTVSIVGTRTQKRSLSQSLNLSIPPPRSVITFPPPSNSNVTFGAVTLCTSLYAGYCLRLAFSRADCHYPYIVLKVYCTGSSIGTGPTSTTSTTRDGIMETSGSPGGLTSCTAPTPGGGALSRPGVGTRTVVWVRPKRKRRSGGRTEISLRSAPAGTAPMANKGVSPFRGLAPRSPHEV